MHLPALEDYFLNLPKKDRVPILSLDDLKTYLIKAYFFLNTEPGPNFSFRAENVQSWFADWFRILSLNPPNMFRDIYDGPRAVPFEHVSRVVDMIHARGLSTGLLFGAGMEGGFGHRSAIRYMAEAAHVFPILVIDPLENFARFGKNRVYPFLDLVVRLEMWRQFPQIGCVTVAPVLTDEQAEDLGSAYTQFFKATHALRHFAEATDPLAWSKVMRGVFNPENFIPHFSAPETSELVKKIMPDLEDDVSDLSRRSSDRLFFDDQI